MKIETKFEIGQKVYYLQYVKTAGVNDWEHKIAYAYVSRIFVNEYLEIGYEIGWLDRMFFENSLFATKEEAEAKLKEMQDEV